jgi:hypothetical protein
MPEGFVIPGASELEVEATTFCASPWVFKGEQLLVCFSAAATEQRLRDTFDYSTPSSARQVLSQLMPGHHSSGFGMAVHAAATEKYGETVGVSRCNARDMKALVMALDFTQESVVYDSWPSNSTWQQHLGSLLPHLQVRPLCEQPAEALHPQAYQGKERLSCVIAAPHPDVVDVLLALGEFFTTRVCCILAPITYFQSAGLGRHTYLEGLRQQGRLGVVLGTPVAAGQVQLVWLVVFKTPETKRVLQNVAHGAVWK